MDMEPDTEAEVISLHPFTVGSSCEWMFVVCPFVDAETNRSYPICKPTKMAKRTKRTCPSMSMSFYRPEHCCFCLSELHFFLFL
jgi:hypothetical protein